VGVPKAFFEGIHVPVMGVSNHALLIGKPTALKL